MSSNQIAHDFQQNGCYMY